MIVTQSIETRRQATALALAMVEADSGARLSDLVEVALTDLAESVGMESWRMARWEPRGRPDRFPLVDRVGSNYLMISRRIMALSSLLKQPASVVWSVAIERLYADVFEAADDGPEIACA